MYLETLAKSQKNICNYVLVGTMKYIKKNLKSRKKKSKISKIRYKVNVLLIHKDLYYSKILTVKFILYMNSFCMFAQAHFREYSYMHSYYETSLQKQKLERFMFFQMIENSRPHVFYKLVVLKNYANCIGVLNGTQVQALNFTKNRTPLQVFSSEFFEIFQNSFVKEHLLHP